MLSSRSYSAPLEAFRFANTLPVLGSSCPVTSLLKANWWREQQVYGIANQGVFAVMMALAALVTIYLQQATGAMSSAPDGNTVIAIGFVWYLNILVSSPLMMFDIIYDDRSPRISPFIRTRPISTAALVFLKLAANMSGLLVAAVVQLLAMLLFGPLFIHDFYAVVGESWQQILQEWQYSAWDTVVIAALFLALFTSLVAIYSTAVTWTVVSARRLIWYLAAIPFYCLLIFLILVVAGEPLEFASMAADVLTFHLWLLLVGAITVTFLFMRTIWQDHVLNRKQMISLIILAGVVWILHIMFTLPNNPLAQSTNLAFAAANLLLGLLPLFAAAFMLWTLHRFRHS